MSDERDYSSQHEAILNEERKTINNRKAKAEAFENKFKEFVEAALKNPNNKKNLGKEAFGVAKDAENGKGQDFGKYNHGFSGGVVEEEFTGFSEDRPWERDGEDEE